MADNSFMTQNQPNQSIGDYLKQNAMQPTGQYNPSPYGLPSFGGFQQSNAFDWGKGVGQLPGMNQGQSYDFGNMNTWNDETLRGGAKSALENYLMPMMQAQQNAQQNAFQNWMAVQGQGSTNAMNAFNMGITGRQTGLQEWAAQQADTRAGEQFGLDKQLANWRYGPGGLEQQNMANQRTLQGLVNSGQLSVQQARNLGELQQLQQSINSIGFGREQLGEQSRAAKAQETLRSTQLANELMAARYAALGRARAPQAQWQRGWG
jgi:hypothetical protein